MKWYEKTWEWIKKYWGVVLSAVALAVGSKAMSIDSGTTVAIHPRLEGCSSTRGVSDRHHLAHPRRRNT